MAQSHDVCHPLPEGLLQGRRRSFANEEIIFAYVRSWDRLCTPPSLMIAFQTPARLAPAQSQVCRGSDTSMMRRSNSIDSNDSNEDTLLSMLTSSTSTAIGQTSAANVVSHQTSNVVTSTPDHDTLGWTFINPSEIPHATKNNATSSPPQSNTVPTIVAETAPPSRPHTSAPPCTPPTPSPSFELRPITGNNDQAYLPAVSAPLAIAHPNRRTNAECPHPPSSNSAAQIIFRDNNGHLDFNKPLGASAIGNSTLPEFTALFAARTRIAVTSLRQLKFMIMFPSQTVETIPCNANIETWLRFKSTLKTRLSVAKAEKPTGKVFQIVVSDADWKDVAEDEDDFGV